MSARRDVGSGRRGGNEASTAGAGAFCIVLAFAAMFGIVARFDRTSRERELTSAERSQWSAGARGSLSLGTVALPAKGRVEVTVCPGDSLAADARVVLATDILHDVTSAALKTDEGHSTHCKSADLDADSHAPIGLRIDGRGTSAVSRVSVRVHERMQPWHALPAALMVLGIALVARSSNREHDEPPGSVPPVVDHRFAVVWVVLAWVGVTLASALATTPVVIAWMRAHPHSTLDDFKVSGLANAMMLLLQHGTLAFVAAALLGAFSPGRGVRALAVNPVSLRGFVLSLACATGLVAVALAATTLLRDTSQSPMGEMLEHAPVRYVIAFGALFAPVSEELFFRGALYRSLERFGAVNAVMVSAILFTAVHAVQLGGLSVGLVPIACVGLVNGTLRARTGGISHAWMVHTMYNAALTATLYLV